MEIRPRVLLLQPCVGGQSSWLKRMFFVVASFRLLSIVSPLQLGKIGEKFIKFLNFCQIRLETPENENQKVPLAKGGASPPSAPRNKNIIILKMAEKN